MRLKVRWLLVVGLIVILSGVVLGVMQNTRSYPELIILAGALCLVAFLLVNEVDRSPPAS
jgi:hypothetical protein